jgi:putative endonuclease
MTELPKKKRNTKEFGNWGECKAAEYLISKGYRIIKKNYRTPHGEIDIIASLGDAVVFIEVKTGRTVMYGYPEVSVTARKQKHILDSAQYYIQNQSNPIENWRIDVISIQAVSVYDNPQITHFENAIYG